MTTYFDVFNIKSDIQLSNIMNNLDLSPNEMFALDDIINSRAPIKYKREKILEMFSGTNNYSYCRKLFLKEELEDSTSQLNMNQTIELNELFALASEKFKKINCSQQFYQMLSQKTSKNFANAFFNMLKSIPEDSNCRFDPQLIVDGKNFAQTIYPFVNELKTFLNGCKSKTKKEEVKESIETQPDMFGGPDTYYKDGIEALDFDNVLDAMEEIAPDMDFVQDSHKNGKYSMIFQPNSSAIELNQKGYKKIKNFMEEKFGKENIAVRLAYAQYAPEIKKLYVTFINQIDVQDELDESALTNSLESLKYHIAVSNDTKTLNHIKDKLSKYFNQTKDTEDRNKLSEILSMINSKLNKIKPTINESCELNSLLEPFKATVVNITVNDDGCLKDCEKEMAINSMKALASHINDEKDCCEENNIENMQTINTLLGTIANYFHTKLCESFEDKLDDAIADVESIIDDFGSYDDEYVRSVCEDIANGYGIDYKKIYYGLTGHKWSALDNDNEYKELHESQSYEKYNDIREELNDIKQRYLDGELDVYDATNEVDGLIGDKSDAEALVDSWDDSSKHGLYGINNEALLNRISNDPNVYIQGRDEIDDGQEPDVEKILDSIKYIADTYNKTFSEAKEIYSEISNTDVYSMEELDEDTVYDHSWYEVKGQKYPRRTKEGVICESENDVLNDILRDLDKYLDDNNSINTEDVCDVIEKNMRKNSIPDESFDDLFVEVNDKLVSHDIRMINESIKDWFKKDNRKYRIMYGKNGGWISKDKNHIVGDLTDTLIVTGLKKAERLAKYFDNGEEPRMFHPDEIKQTNKGWNFKYTQEFLDILEKVKNSEMSEEEAKNYFEKIGLPVSQYWYYLKLALPNKKKVNEMCSGGACCAGAVATVPSPVKPKSPKRKHKKSKVDEMALNMFKRQIIEDVNSQINANGNHYEYKDGFLYINGDIAKTKSKYQMLEALDEMIELDTLKGFNSNEMLMLEDIEASGNVGNADDNNQNNNNNSNNNADNNNNQQNANQTPNQDNLGDVNQNVTQDSDLTPQQRQLKKDTEQVLDQSMSSNTDTNVTLNQGMDNNNDQTSNNQTTSTNNVKYKVIGKDDSDSNNIKYIIQDPNTKETQVVDATKLRLEK